MELYDEIVGNPKLNLSPKVLASLLEEPGNAEEKILFYLDLRDNLTLKQHLALREITAKKTDDLREIVFLANLTPGPVILPTRTRGYGLFADREYEGGEIVTMYGGDKVTGETEGDYVLYNQVTGVTTDGRYGYKLGEKGRWINEYSRKTRDRNKHKNVVFISTKRGIGVKAIGRVIPFATELFLNYGADYNRSAYLECAVCSSAAWQVCARCEKVPYCSVDCQTVGWDAGHKVCCSE